MMINETEILFSVIMFQHVFKAMTNLANSANKDVFMTGLMFVKDLNYIILQTQ